MGVAGGIFAFTTLRRFASSKNNDATRKTTPLRAEEKSTAPASELIIPTPYTVRLAQDINVGCSPQLAGGYPAHAVVDAAQLL